MDGITKISKSFFYDNREEYFENPLEEYFNLEKKEIKYIKSSKKGRFLRQVPYNYTPNGFVGFALIRGMNCQGKCTYCYLQTYFKSSDMVRFTNFDDYLDFLDMFIQSFQQNYPNQNLIFYDGDFYDSLGYADLKDNINQINMLIDLISKYEKVFLEIRTKCLTGNLKSYASLKISKKVIYGITFSPNFVIQNYEIGCSNLTDRIEFAKFISNKGGSIGVRIDPIIISLGLNHYKELIDNIKVESLNIHSWSIGELRLKDKLYKYLLGKNSILVQDLILREGFYRYEDSLKNDFFNEIDAIIGEKTHKCMDY